MVLTGQYLRSQDKLFKDDVTLLMRDRKTDIHKKPDKFILIDLGKGYEYVSSLYQLGKDVYNFDTAYQGHKYKLDKKVYKLYLNKNSATIKESKA